MKVAIVQQHVDTRRGGAETSTVEMARHLARLGLDVSIICRAAGGLHEEIVGVKLVPVAARAVTRAGQTCRFVQAAGAVCRRSSFDIVHAVTPCLAANVYQPRGGTYPETIERSLAAIRSPLSRGLRRFGRRFNISQRFLMRVERTLLTKYRQRVHVAAVSDYVRRQVAEGFGFPAERVRVVYNGVDIAPLDEAERARRRAALRAELGLGDRAPVVLFVAHNFRLKGLAELIRAMSAAPSEHEPGDWTVLVAGRDRPERYRQLAEQQGVAARLRFVGAGMSIRGFYAAADALVHPTWYDPCSRVVLEALSLGLPVVTTRLNGAAEVIEPGRQGEIIETPADSAALATAVNHALEPQVVASCRAAAPAMHAQLSMWRHARDLSALYEHVLSRRS